MELNEIILAIGAALGGGGSGVAAISTWLSAYTKRQNALSELQERQIAALVELARRGGIRQDAAIELLLLTLPEDKNAEANQIRQAMNDAITPKVEIPYG